MNQSQAYQEHRWFFSLNINHVVIGDQRAAGCHDMLEISSSDNILYTLQHFPQRAQASCRTCITMHHWCLGSNNSALWLVIVYEGLCSVFQYMSCSWPTPSFCRYKWNVFTVIWSRSDIWMTPLVVAWSKLNNKMYFRNIAVQIKHDVARSTTTTKLKFGSPVELTGEICERYPIARPLRARIWDGRGYGVLFVSANLTEVQSL